MLNGCSPHALRTRRQRTDQRLLMQQFEAREVCFRREGRKVYFLHIHKA